MTADTAQHTVGGGGGGRRLPPNQTQTTGAHRATHELTQFTEPYLPRVARRWTHSGTMRDRGQRKETTNKNKKNKQNDQTNGNKPMRGHANETSNFKRLRNDWLVEEHFADSQL